MPLSGWIILDKPTGITSAHAVAKVKRLLSSSLRAGGEAIHPEYNAGLPRRGAPRNDKIKIGHAGTLDPLASGILPLALGEATKTVGYMMDASKAYAFTVTWGAETDTDDLEGNITHTSPKRPQKDEILAILPQFTGEIAQVPPNYSAIKVDGKRAYAMARDGNTLELKSRKVRVDSLAFISSSPLEGEDRGGGHYTSAPPLNPLPQGEGKYIEYATFICHCGKGTYIRSLARDMGRAIGCLGHITMLRRLKVGKFSENHAISLEKLEEMVHKGDLGFVLPVEAALDDILALSITPEQAKQIMHGMTVAYPSLPDSETVLAKAEGKLVAICQALGGNLKPIRVFNL